MAGPRWPPRPGRRSSDRNPPQLAGLFLVARSRSALHRTRMVEGTLGSHHKEGSKKMSKHSMICAGIDTGKRKLDVAIRGRADELQVDNMPDGHGTLSAWLRRHRAKRVGIEASGGYEPAVGGELCPGQFEALVVQPAHGPASALFPLPRAKNY